MRWPAPAQIKEEMKPRQEGSMEVEAWLGWCLGRVGSGDALELDAWVGGWAWGKCSCEVEGWVGLALGEHTKEIEEKSGKIGIFWEEQDAVVLFGEIEDGGVR